MVEKDALTRRVEEYLQALEQLHKGVGLADTCILSFDHERHGEELILSMMNKNYADALKATRKLEDEAKRLNMGKLLEALMALDHALEQRNNLQIEETYLVAKTLYISTRSYIETIRPKIFVG